MSLEFLLTVAVYFLIKSMFATGFDSEDESAFLLPSPFLHQTTCLMHSLAKACHSPLAPAVKLLNTGDIWILK